MNLLKNIRKNSVRIVLVLSILSHILLVNFNSAEWGDTYRILRAAEFVRNGAYPVDEKRPPLFSAILSLYPEGMDPVFFGRVVLLIVSSLSILAFYLLLKKIIPSEKYRTIALLFFVLNPIYFYWSLRVYADVPFSLYVLLIFLLYYRYDKKLTNFNAFILGLFSAVSILIRFEGYLLLGAVLAALTYKRPLSRVVFGLAGSFFVLLPYILYRNPLNSTYLSEPAGRSYSMVSIIIFLVSLFYSYGFLYGPAVLYETRHAVWKFLKSHVLVSFFMLLSLTLILLWPAAIPRLFVNVIPFLIILLVLGLEVLENQKKFTRSYYLSIVLMLVAYVVSQYFLRLQFMIVLRPVFALIIGLNVLGGLYLLKRKYLTFYFLTFISCAVWTASTLYIHKDIYRSISEASQYVSTSIKGKVVHNDINSVADWYLNYSPQRNRSVSGDYYAVKSNADLNYKELYDLNADYLMITNEHDMSWQPDLGEINYLEEERSFRYNVNSGNFFTGLYKFKK